jgi:hypothetical protein
MKRGLPTAVVQILPNRDEVGVSFYHKSENLHPSAARAYYCFVPSETIAEVFSKIEWVKARVSKNAETGLTGILCAVFL